MKYASAPALRYGAAVLAVAVALLIKVLLDPVINEQSPFLLLAAGVMVGAWFGGLGPGLVATVFAALAANYLFLEPRYSFTAPSIQAVPLMLFMVQGVVISALTQALHTARSRSETSAWEALSHQESLRESERLYRAVVENAAENIFLVDAETRRILEVNAALPSSLGYSSEELKTMTLYDIVAADREGIDRNIGRIREGETFAGERCYRRRDGTLMDVEVSASAISYRGREAMCVVAHDVTDRKRSEVALRRSLLALLALYEAGQILSSSLMREEIAEKLLQIMRRVFDPTAAAISLLHDGEGLRAWHSEGPEEALAAVRETPGVEAARRAALEGEEHRTFVPEDGGALAALFLPLRVRDRIIGLLELYGQPTLTTSEVVNTCTSLANQAASALENARLYEELTQRERQLQDLVGKLLTAQEEERRRVAYDVHDGLAQTAAAAYQYLQGFARHHIPASARGREQLQEALELVRTTVGEARQVISDLRPTALDDFGLATAVHQQVSSLRAEGRRVEYTEALGQGRLPAQVETTLFRVAQEALTNVRKHAGPAGVHVTLERLDGAVFLVVRDEGSGFRPGDRTGASPPGEQVGLSGMRERVSLLGGRFEIHSEPGAGTSVIAEVPLPREEDSDG
jgi:PAS domain S-box-containing protein